MSSRRQSNSAKADRFIRPAPDGGWEVIGPKHELVSFHQTDAQALAWAKMTLLQEQEGGRISVEGRNGTVREERV